MSILYPPDKQFTIFDFDKDCDVRDWRVVDDGVMGGMSTGTFGLDSDGHAVFSGEVSLENNGGFSSVRYGFDPIAVTEYEKVVIKLRGDGREYQFRIKADLQDYYSYITPFTTTGEWQEVEIMLHDMYPTFRGRNLNMPNFSGDAIEEIRFLIANKKAEKFELLIDWIVLR